MDFQAEMKFDSKDWLEKTSIYRIDDTPIEEIPMELMPAWMTKKYLVPEAS